MLFIHNCGGWQSKGKWHNQLLGRALLARTPHDGQSCGVIVHKEERFHGKTASPSSALTKTLFLWFECVPKGRVPEAWLSAGGITGM